MKKLLGIGLLMLAAVLFSSLAKGTSLVPDSTTTETGVSKVFYVYNPPRFSGESEMSRHIAFTSFTDNNMVSIYKLDDGKIEKEGEFTMDTRKVKDYVPSGNFLKIVSGNPVMAFMYNTLADNRYGGTFIPSETGEFLGKKFIFPASFFMPVKGGPYVFNLDIFAVEPGIVEVKNSSGTIAVLPVAAETYSTITSSTVQDADKSFFEVTSTAGILVCFAGGWSWSVALSDTGNVIGNVHYGHTRAPAGAAALGSFLVLAFAPGQATMLNMSNERTISHIFTQAGEIWDGPNYASAVRFEADVPILVQTGYTFSQGQNYAGGRMLSDGKVEYWVYTASRRGPPVIFAPEKTSMTINDTKVELEADQYYLLSGPPAKFHVISDVPIVLQIQAEENAFLVAPSGIPANKPKEVSGGPNLVMIGAGVAVVAVVAFILWRRTRGS